MKWLLLLYLWTPAAFAEVIHGPIVEIGSGTAASFVIRDNQKNVTALGINFDSASLTGLPDEEHEYEYFLDLPADVEIPPFDHLTLNWNPHGHEPTQIYGVPHFDYHFYIITKHEQHDIMCDGTDDAICMKQPAADKIPPYYVPGPGGVPMMGWHWVDLRSPEFNGKGFSATFIYGFYNGDLAFVEPMMALSYLQTKPQFEKDIPLPKVAAKKGYYPSSYSLEYNAVTDRYCLTLKKLVWLNDI